MKRFILYIVIILTGIAAFIGYGIATKKWDLAWTLIPLSLIVVSGIEMIVAFFTGYKNKYIPSLIFIFIFFVGMYFILCSLKITPWHPWYVLALIGVIIDGLYLLVKFLRKKFQRRFADNVAKDSVAN